MTELSRRRSWLDSIVRWRDRARRGREAEPQRRTSRGLANQVGMTLIEIMVVVAIIGLMLGTVGVVAFNKWKKAQVTNGKQTVANMKSAIEHFALDNPGQTCPKDLAGLVEDKQIKKVPKDPWGEDLVYKCPGENDPDSADVSSKGPDKKEGTDDDINSWEI